MSNAIVSILPYVPRSLVWRISKRYIAGTQLEDALRLVADLNRKGMAATLDVLGEDSTQREHAIASKKTYLEALDSIAARKLDCNISVKLSQMALRFDPALCVDIMEELAQRAQSHGNFVRIDMEDSSVTDATLEIYRQLRRTYPGVGVVIQACLRRSKDDVRALLAEGPTNLRLCKGIYIEPEEIAFRGRQEVREAFRKLLRQMFEGGIERVGIATHDPPLVEDALSYIRANKIEPKRYEFQMLLGVAEKLGQRLVREGHRMRIYVPFGAEWYAYSSRRLRENPRIAGHIVKNLLLPR